MRKPDKDVVAKSKLYLIDPAKVIKEDKTVKLAKAKFLKKGKKKKAKVPHLDLDNTHG